MPETQRFEGENIVVTYNPQLCIRSAACGKALPDVFNSLQKPWVNPDQSSADNVAHAVRQCPSGALQFERKDGKIHESPPQKNTMRAVKNGPLQCAGQMQMLDAFEKIAQHLTRAVFCRCGLSQNKPYCSGRHAEIVMNDEEEDTDNDKPLSAPKDTPPPPDAPESEPHGPVQIKMAPKGPLLAKGPMEVCDNEGKVIAVKKTAAFCQCGNSRKKPFCDGTHINPKSL